jgi:hypothetical protein
MLGYLRKTIGTRRVEIDPPPPNEEGIEAVEARVSPRVRSKDQKYNTIRSMFESKRTAPIIPPNESVSFFLPAIFLTSILCSANHSIFFSALFFFSGNMPVVILGRILVVLFWIIPHPI